jgi:hypothetical protein
MKQPLSMCLPRLRGKFIRAGGFNTPWRCLGYKDMKSDPNALFTES